MARQDITPPVGIYARSWGASGHDVADSIHRPLTATAITFQQEPDGSPLALVSLDLGWWRRVEDEWRLRSTVLNELSLDADRLLLHFTHTHAGPSLCPAEAAKPGGYLIGPYLYRLADACTEVVRSALRSHAPAVLDWAYGASSLARNRDLPDPDGRRWICGFNPAGEADTTLLVGRVTYRDRQDAAGGARGNSGKSGRGRRIMATIVNYACHPTTLAWQNRAISPDFVGAMRDVVEQMTDEAPCLFLQGASGELAPREDYTDDISVADRNGRQLGYAAVSVLEGMLPPQMALQYDGVVESGAPLATWRLVDTQPAADLRAACVSVPLALKNLPSVAEIDAEIAGCADRALVERLERKKWVRQGVGDASSALAPAWAWRIGDALLIAHPNEAYSLLQRSLRASFPGRPIAVLNVTNGHVGYLPPAVFYDRDIYPVWQTPFAAGGLERLIEDAGNALNRLLA